MIAFLISCAIGFGPPGKTPTTLPADYEGPWPWEARLEYKWPNEFQHVDELIVRCFKFGDFGKLAFPKYTFLVIDEVESKTTATAWVCTRSSYGNVIHRDRVRFYGINLDNVTSEEIVRTPPGVFRALREGAYRAGDLGDTIVAFHPVPDAEIASFRERHAAYKLRVRERERKLNALKRQRREEIEIATSVRVKFVSKGPSHSTLDTYKITVKNGSDFYISGTEVLLEAAPTCDGDASKKLTLISIEAHSEKSKNFAWPKGCQPSILTRRIDLSYSSYEGLKEKVVEDSR